MHVSQCATTIRVKVSKDAHCDSVTCFEGLDLENRIFLCFFKSSENWGDHVGVTLSRRRRKSVILGHNGTIVPGFSCDSVTGFRRL